MSRFKRKESIFVRKHIVKKLRLYGVFNLDGKNIACVKSKILIDKYKELFNKDAVLDYRDYVKKLRKEAEYEKSMIKSSSSTEDDYVYVVGCVKNEVCKIGYSKNPLKRIKELQTGCPYRLHIFVIVRGNISTEHLLHKKYRKYKSYGEWFFYKGELRSAIEKIHNTDKDLKKIILANN